MKKKLSIFVILLIIYLGLLGIIAVDRNGSLTKTSKLSSINVLLSSSLEQDTNSSLANVTLYGEKNLTNFGDALTGIGDVNGDGMDDFLVSAPYFDDISINEGKVYLFFGKDTGWEKNINCSEADASFIGENENDNFGQNMGSAGDINGDGLNDFLISSTKNDQGDSNTGKTYLFFGKETGWEKNINCSEADVSFIGEYAEDKSGIAISGVGDVNNDGFDDFLISAPGYDVSVDSDEGKVYLFFGKESGWEKNTNCSEADASFLGESQNDEFGNSVTNGGDVNKDGYDDYLISSIANAQGGNYAGKIYLFFGKNSGWSNNFNCSNSDASFIGEFAGDYAGKSISGGGDINGDGYYDFIIGAPSNDEYGDVSGKSYIFFGKATDWDRDINCSEADVTFIGETEMAFSGGSVSIVGDVNNDNYDDILIASHMHNMTVPYVGKVYLIYGKSSGWSSRSYLTNADASFYGEAERDFLGQMDSISGIGDINGDNSDDMIIGANFNDEYGKNTGKAYIFFGVITPDGGIDDGMIPGYSFTFFLPFSFIMMALVAIFIKKKRIIKSN